MDSKRFRARRHSRRALLVVAALTAVVSLCAGAARPSTPPEDSVQSIGSFREASAVAADAGGAIYVTDRGTHEVLKFSSAGTLLLRAGIYGWGSDALDRPSDLTINNGLDLYVADFGNRRVRRYDRNLTPVEDLSLADEHGARPLSVTQTREGDLFVLDAENRTIIRITAGGVRTSFGGVGTGAGMLRAPVRLRAKGNSQIVVQDDSSLAMFDVYGNFLRRLPLPPAVRTFTLDGDTICLLTDSVVAALRPDGSLRPLVLLPESAIAPAPAADLLVREGRVMILLRQKLLVLPVVDPLAR